MQGTETEIIEAAEIVIDDPANPEPPEQLDNPEDTRPELSAENDREKKQEKGDANAGAPKNPIKLKKPILINGKERTELPWSQEELSVEQFFEAESKAHEGIVNNSILELDSRIHFYVGAELVTNADPSIDVNDLKQLSGRDIFALVRVGRFFAGESGD